MSDKNKFTTTEYKTSFEIDIITNTPIYRIEKESHDSAEDMREAYAERDRVIAKHLADSAPARFLNSTHPLRGVIERIMKDNRIRTFEIDDAATAWDELLRMASSMSNTEAIINGYVPGKGIEYWGVEYEKSEGDQFDYINKKAFFGIFARQREFHAKAREAT